MFAEPSIAAGATSPALTGLTTLTQADRRIRQLADAMYELNARGHDVTVGLLLKEGFSRHELAEYGDAARDLAGQRFVRKLDTVDTESARHERRLRLAIGLTLGLMPNEADVIAQLRAAGLAPAEIAEFWPRLVGALTEKAQSMRAPQ